jgi:hypothetical protein
MNPLNESSSVRSDIVAVRKDYAAPPGLDFILDLCYKDTAPMVLGGRAGRKLKTE